MTIPHHNPFPPGDSRANDTFDWGGLLVQDVVRMTFWDRKSEILDVGPGFGKYRYLLPEYPMDACEIWEAAIYEKNIGSIYRKLYLGDICDFVNSPEWYPYDLVIMGDVFEHIERKKARAAVSRILDTCQDLFIITPYECPQGIEEGNPYQVHIQKDLTPEIMEQEFPDLQLVQTEYRDEKPYKGFYRRKKAHAK